MAMLNYQLTNHLQIISYPVHAQRPNLQIIFCLSNSRMASTPRAQQSGQPLGPDWGQPLLTLCLANAA